MVFLGLILAAAAAAVGVGVLLDNNVPVTVSAYGQAVSGFTERELFVGGMAVASLFLLGWILIISGIRRARRLRGELDELDDLRENREAYIQTLEADKARLTRELEDARMEWPGGARSPSGTGVSGATGASGGVGTSGGTGPFGAVGSPGGTTTGAARSAGMADMPGDPFGSGAMKEDLGVRVASSDSSFFRRSG